MKQGISSQQLKPQCCEEARDEKSTRDDKRKREAKGDPKVKGEERMGQINSPRMEMY